MNKDSQERLSLWEPLLKEHRHLSVSQQTFHASQTHRKHTVYTYQLWPQANRQGHRDRFTLALSNFQQETHKDLHPAHDNMLRAQFKKTWQFNVKRKVGRKCKWGADYAILEVFFKKKFNHWVKLLKCDFLIIALKRIFIILSDETGK